MAIKYAVIKGKIYEVYNSEDKYVPEIMNNQSALLLPDGLVYPKISKANKNEVGYYEAGPFLIFNPPSEKEKKKYTYSEIKHFDYSDASSVEEVLENKRKYEEFESSVLSTADKIFRPIIKQDDLPEMIAIKTAATLKHMDLDKYSGRFGDNFNNDKRLFDKPSISMPKLKTMCENCDMDAYLIIKDKSPNVPNPMGRTVKVRLTNIDENDDSKGGLEIL